ncbi:uncharacterized protein SAMN02745248_00091 [Hathewaya proteolytica DSM 3090]|uniref:DUF177 domain-containing protein n=1 Tax=Hathewaya proteolytica DSM 3090 TaxID=1121331 RepID=A0A1M6J8Y0_9CLOT|nr:DUF177 domain-containing protein [Hathewaya proteolytica]SHJ43133.1 uncharacterized protein SAMN02745248_00091 [Hathewaya proteolytica DSM 3090]
MKIDILELINGKKDKMEIHTEISRDKFNFNDKEMTFLGPIRFSGVMKKKKDSYVLKGICEVILTCPCDRCLDEAVLNLKFEIEQQYSTEELGLDVKLIVNNVIDLYEVVEEYLYLNIPLQIICSPSCKGLCSYCGVNLNKEQCKCSDEVEGEVSEQEIDPRFLKLKSLFK